MKCHISWSTEVVPAGHIAQSESSVVTCSESWINGESVCIRVVGFKRSNDEVYPITEIFPEL